MAGFRAYFSRFHTPRWGWAGMDAKRSVQPMVYSIGKRCNAADAAPSPNPKGRMPAGALQRCGPFVENDYTAQPAPCTASRRQTALGMKPTEIGYKQLAFALCLFWGVHTLAHAQPERGESRGELLYEAHCNTCHTSKIHWRERKLAIDWSSLKIQVRRWQASIGLDWSEEEITDVTNYLNAAYYGFPAADQKGLSQGKMPAQVLRQY